ncbi:Histidine triad (HIT) protein like protein [Aduncisulcus paluster]|uniref:Histidine triad (HIT) protein like protein n=1 Tax=Aduncisulcus paluster TaxID=2918883 RepID=A0ABQ5JT28_9EUKA|nr:Histidine triad (HIT) protein like protein [Aduncisulcus paluster]|eukprot:gnl/Carplike_NY0171/2418_a3249_764.p1 GENE.gnl/Carplike_NY0171/2418_a3249_764~~gnl/Carplike_NY0171/2418_a3249_764.p1  ORF type:complete len:152 (+),score=45.23 gnl/Carplike_NY0171/2418_a3249_764:142-597(+)
MARCKDCVFCKIISGEIPSIKLFEDERCIVIFDINPAAKGHFLVIPKAHYEKVHEAPDAVLKHILPIAGKVAKNLKFKDYNIVSNNGEGSGQIIPHIHFHVIPKYSKKEAAKLGEGLVYGETKGYEFDAKEAKEMVEHIGMIECSLHEYAD